MGYKEKWREVDWRISFDVLCVQFPLLLPFPLVSVVLSLTENNLETHSSSRVSLRVLPLPLYLLRHLVVFASRLLL